MAISRNILFFLVALQILNMGLFAQDIPILALQTQNQINSVSEYIAEVTFGIKDAFPENHHQNKTNKHTSNTSFHLKVVQFQLFKPNNSCIYFCNSVYVGTVYHKCPLPIFYKNFVVETNSPPPKNTV